MAQAFGLEFAEFDQVIGMSNETTFAISFVPISMRQARAEICEHKGIGHPDSICDGVAEAVSQALSAAFLREYGAVRHYNVDKALLIAGQSAPSFGGGKILVPIRLIICGRATSLSETDMEGLVSRAAHDYLAKTLRCDPNIFSIEAAVREGSADLRQVFSRVDAVPLANDTSFGAGYAPYSNLEKKVLELAEVLRSAEFRSAFPAAGDDFKIMGRRVDDNFHFTVALAFIGREITSVSNYFEVKTEVTRYLERAADVPGTIGLNMLDDPNATDESGIYLTVTGLSAEHGDDGEVGRGNRVSGLITPSRTMSLEAAAGKNPIAHVGKLYNVLALEMARAICSEVEQIDEASVHILSTIGKPVSEPQLVSIQVAAAKPLDQRTMLKIEDAARACLARVGSISQRLIAGGIRVF